MIKEIDRTSIASWSPAKEQEPLLALGTVAGALDASFSSKTELEIFSLDLASPSKSLQKLGGIPCNARYTFFHKDLIEYLGEMILLLVERKTESWICGIQKRYSKVMKNL
jgi:hypothetical protein